MGQSIRFEVSAEVGKAVAGLLKVAEAEAKVASATAKAGAAATASGRQQEQAIERVNRASQRSGRVAGSPVFASGYQVRRSDLATSQTMRAIAAGGSVGSSNPLVQSANVLAADRATRAAFLHAERSRNRVASAKMMYFGRDEHLAAAQGVAADVRAGSAARLGDHAWLAANMASPGAFNFGADRYHAKARRLVTGRIAAGGSEVAGLKISPDQLESMVGQQAGRLQARAASLKSALTFTGGLAAGAFLGLTTFIERRHADLHAIGEAGVSFQRGMAPLLSLGTNSMNPGRVKHEVLSRSSAMGLDWQEVANARFSLESGTANLGKGTQKQLFNAGAGISEVAGGNLNTNVTAMIKVWQTYGAELGSVNMAQSKLFKVAQEGFVTFEDLAELLPDILPAAKAVGMSFDEIGGAIITATQVGGRTEKTMTGIRNAILELNKAQKDGVVLTGSFSEKISQLAKIDPKRFTDMFGERTVAVMAALSQHSKGLADNIDHVAGAVGNEVFQNFLNRADKDKPSGDAATAKALDEQKKNADVNRFASSGTERFDLVRLKAGAAGYQQSKDPLYDAMDFTGGGAKLAAANDKNVYLGVAQQISDLGEAGDEMSQFKANRLKLQFGKEYDYRIYGSRGEDGENGVHTDKMGRKYRNANDEDAELYTRLMASSGGKLGMKDFLRYEEMKEAGDPNAAKFIGKVMSEAAQHLKEAAASAKAAAEKQKKGAADQADASKGAKNRNAHAE